MELLTGRIYIIRSPNTEMVYVGSTIQKLHRRFKKHIYDWRTRYERSANSKLILDKGDAYIELLEEVQVESKEELEIIEQKWINETPNTVNKRKSYISEEERAEYLKTYRETHREESLEYQKIYQKIWRETYKEKINEKGREKIRCEVCDCLISNSYKSKHERSAKHIHNLEKSS